MLGVIDLSRDLQDTVGIQRHQRQGIAETIVERADKTGGAAAAVNNVELDRGHCIDLQAKPGADLSLAKSDLRFIRRLDAITLRGRRARLPATAGFDAEFKQSGRLPICRHGAERKHAYSHSE